MANQFGWGMSNPQFGQRQQYQTWNPNAQLDRWGVPRGSSQQNENGSWSSPAAVSPAQQPQNFGPPQMQAMFWQNSPGGNVSSAPVLAGGNFNRANGGAGGGGAGGGGGGAGGGWGQPWQGMNPVNYQGQGVGGGYMSGAMEAEMGRAKERMNQGFADAARRAGQSGMLMSSDYQQALGGVARNAMNDVNAQGYNYAFNAAQQDANRALQEWQQQGNWDLGAWNSFNDRGLNAWKTQGDWDMQAQLANQQQDDGQLMQIMSMLGGMF